MGKTRIAVKGFILCSVTALLLTNLSSSQADFVDSGNASITAKATNASGIIVSNGPYAQTPGTNSMLHTWTTKISVNPADSYVQGHNFTITNTGSSAQYLTLKTDLTLPEIPNLTRNATVMNHTKANVFVGSTQVYSGLLSQMNTTPALIPAGSTTTYRIDIAGFYSSELDNAELFKNFTTVPIKVRMSPASSNAQPSSWDTTLDTGAWYQMSDYKIRPGDAGPNLYSARFDHNCMIIEWYSWGGAGVYKDFTIRYSQNADMSSALYLDISEPRADLQRLYLNTTYYYQILVKNGFKEEWSEVQSFVNENNDGKPYFDTCPNP